jgi:hypothetical protein
VLELRRVSQIDDMALAGNEKRRKAAWWAVLRR